ncbi:hypothetical protein PR002_g26777 [Phytophthora rubi]|uniref:Uncharacterized protein n=1 Tax=Phytophthora rubi TaxID=129364 RepID=A0A6A3HU75_9STRA|nr:hypothetical protein PR002_g26777 [Phytophthora rubi]
MAFPVSSTVAASCERSSLVVTAKLVACSERTGASAAWDPAQKSTRTSSTRHCMRIFAFDEVLGVTLRA